MEAQNPFAPNTPARIEQFVNRQREIDLIYGHIDAVQRGNVAVNGHLGIGKTSLLRYLSTAEIASRHGIDLSKQILLYVDIQSITPFSASRFWRRIAHSLRRFENTSLQAHAQRLLDHGEVDIIDIEEMLDAVADEGLSLALFLDEFEWALQCESPEALRTSRDFLAQTASLARRTPRVLSLVVATQDSLVDATRVIEGWRGSPFATVFTNVLLKALSREEADMLLLRSLKQSGVSFDSDSRARLYAISKGQPSALQAAAFALFHGRAHAHSEQQVWAAAEQAAKEALESMNAEAEQASDSALGKNDSNGFGMPQNELAANGLLQGGKDGKRPGIVIDTISGEVKVAGRTVEALTSLEFSLLQLLCAQPGRLCSKEDIIRDVWGEEFAEEIDDSRVEKLISRLRRKIEPLPGRPRYLRTVRGRGYRYMA